MHGDLQAFGHCKLMDIVPTSIGMREAVHCTAGQAETGSAQAVDIGWAGRRADGQTGRQADGQTGRVGRRAERADRPAGAQNFIYTNTRKFLRQYPLLAL